MASITIQQLGPTDINTAKNLTMVGFAGDLDQVSIEQDSEKVEQLINEVPNGSIMLFDFSNLMYINSRSISYLVNWYMTLEKKMAKLILFALRPNILDILDTTGITNLIPVFQNFLDVKIAIEQNKIKFGDSPTSLEPMSPSDPISGGISRPENAQIEEENLASSPQPEPTVITFGEDETKPQKTEKPTPQNTAPSTENIAPDNSNDTSITRQTTEGIKPAQQETEKPETSDTGSFSIQRTTDTDNTSNDRKTSNTENSKQTGDETQETSEPAPTGSLTIDRFSAPKEEQRKPSSTPKVAEQTVEQPAQPSAKLVPEQANQQVTQPSTKQITEQEDNQKVSQPATKQGAEQASPQPQQKIEIQNNNDHSENDQINMEQDKGDEAEPSNQETVTQGQEFKILED